MPKVQISAKVSRGGRSHTIRSLCQVAEIECRVTGPSIERKVYLNEGALSVVREPGSTGTVSVTLPAFGADEQRKRAVLALGILAYAVFDYAARESMRGRPEAQMTLPVGRPRKIRTLSGAERQRRWRAAHAGTKESAER